MPFVILSETSVIGEIDTFRINYIEKISHYNSTMVSSIYFKNNSFFF